MINTDIFQRLTKDDIETLNNIREAIPTEELRTLFDKEQQQIKKKYKQLFNASHDERNNSKKLQKLNAGANEIGLQTFVDGYTNKEFVKSIAIMASLAEIGASLPIKNLAMFFAEGYLVEKNYAKAIALYDIVPRQTEDESITMRIAGLYNNGGYGVTKSPALARKMVQDFGLKSLSDEEKALMDKATIGDDASLDALYDKAKILYENKMSNKQNVHCNGMAKAYAMYSIAANLNHANSQIALSEYYKEPWGYLEDPTTSKKWAKRAKKTKEMKETYGFAATRADSTTLGTTKLPSGNINISQIHSITDNSNSPLVSDKEAHQAGRFTKILKLSRLRGS